MFFDGADLSPLFCAPPLALLAMVVVYILARPVGKLNNEVAVLLALFTLPMVCCSSAILGIGEVNPRPWFEPRENDVIGIWQLDDDEREFLASYEIAVSPHQLVFDADGTFFMFNVPVALHTEQPFVYTPSALSGSGTWKLGDEPNVFQQRTVVILTLETPTDFPVGEEPIFILYFRGHLAPYTLIMVHPAFSISSFERDNGGNLYQEWFGD